MIKYLSNFFWLLVATPMCLGLYGCPMANPQTNVENSIPEIEEDQIRIEYIAHASFLLHNKEHTLLLDPFADSVWISHTFPRDISANAIFSTHPHYDHDGGIFRNLKPYWEGKIPFYTEPSNHTIGGFKMQGLKGKHCEPYGKEFGQKNTIWISEVAGMRIAHWGDNGPINDTLARDLPNIDVLMLPIDDTDHILKQDEIVEILSTVEPKIIIPMHYKIAALEKTEGVPKNLGTIDNYISTKENVLQLDGNNFILSKSKMPKSAQHIVFQHSPLIKVPE